MHGASQVFFSNLYFWQNYLRDPFGDTYTWKLPISYRKSHHASFDSVPSMSDRCAHPSGAIKREDVREKMLISQICCIFCLRHCVYSIARINSSLA